MDISRTFEVINKFLIRESIFKDSKDFLLKRKDYPKITSVIDFFTFIDVDSKVLKIKKNQLQKLNSIFFAVTLDFGLVLITKIRNNQIKYYTFKGWKKENIDEFNKKWNGIIIITEHSYLKKGTFFKKSIWFLNSNKSLLSFIIICSSLLYLSLNIIIILIILKLIGIILCLIIYKTDVDKSFNQKICRISSKFDCSSVINSKSASIIKGFSLNDFSFFYFSFGFTFLFFSLLSGINQIILTYLSFLTFPFILYSIFCQWIILKKWCALCLMIISLLIIEITLGFTTYNINFTINYNVIIYILYSIILTIIFTFYIKKAIYDFFNYKNIFYKYYQIKYNKSIFNHLLQENKIIFNDYDVEITSNNSTNKLIIVINPYCTLCEIKLKKIRKLIKKNSNLFRLSIIFTQSNNNEFALYFIALQNKSTGINLLIALINWFETKDFKAFKKKHPIGSDFSEHETIFKKQTNWVIQNNITKTPLIILNNTELSEYYDIEDLQYIL